ncbi:MAG: M48 family metalloprotease, partial [Planctomycetes bacterium]|nr:M48 family metalloprotease [Planctomycetota bacterium]
MPRKPSLYPPSPTNVPEDLTQPTGHYRLRVFLVLVSTILFLLFYAGLVVGSGFLTVGSLLFLPIPVNVLAAGFCGLFFLFLVKGFFKRQQVSKSSMVEVTEDDQPRLFVFIEQLCDETGAPFPDKVFLNYQVNASVFYRHSILNMFVPPKKNLLIGMGLVNALNLGEFKAVLAHEFGHFSQKSMNLGAYVYVAHRVILDMVAGRDWLDNFIDRLCRSRSRVAVIGWTCWGIIWLFRQVLKGCFYGIKFLDMSLARQMEFNADLVAVSVTGSDAIIHALARLDFANASLNQAFQDLGVASQHNLYSSDLFHHHNHAADYLRRIRKDPHLGEAPPLPADEDLTVEVFEEGDEAGIPLMWADHPPNYQREQNAKEHYIRWPIDNRSPWVLFDDPRDVRERVTWKFYRVELGLRREVVLAEPGDVQQFVEDEHAETTYDPRYQGLYDNRFINPGEVKDLVKTAKAHPYKPQVLAG